LVYFPPNVKTDYISYISYTAPENRRLGGRGGKNLYAESEENRSAGFYIRMAFLKKNGFGKL